MVPSSWHIEDGGKKLAEITQHPLRLAWAITIHKSQGMNLDRAEIDLSKAFTFGQGYVALSRLRSLDGLSLSGFSHTALLIHPEVRDFDTNLKTLSDLAESAYTMLSKEDQEVRQKNFVAKVGGMWPKDNIFTSDKKSPKKAKITSRSTYEETKILLGELGTPQAIAVHRDLSFGTIMSHLEVLKNQGELPALETLNLIPPERLEIITNIFTELKTDKLTPVFEYLKSADFDTTYDELRIARLFLNL